MKRTVLTLALTLGMNMLPALAADGAGNGGGAWVCHNRDELKTIRWAKLVDLYEAEKEFKLSLKNFTETNYHDIVEKQKVRLFSIGRYFYEDLLPHLDAVEANLVNVDADVKFIDDALLRVGPPHRDCLGGDIKYVQLANYTHYQAILLNEYLFTHPSLAETDKAALIFHEAIYAYLRKQDGDKNSVRTRQIVGYLFSDLSNTLIAKEIEKVLARSLNFDFNPTFIPIPGRNFEVMTTEVTQSMWFEVMGNNPSYFKNEKYCPTEHVVRTSPSGSKVELCPHHPVERVSFNMVEDFIRELKNKMGKTYRLPTEEEWKYTAGAFNIWGAIFVDNSGGQTHPVGPARNYSDLTNDYGLFDMYGNVWEWTSSMDNEGSSGRVIRGGGWGSVAENLRSAYRSYLGPSLRLSNVGFRLVRTLR